MYQLGPIHTYDEFLFHLFLMIFANGGLTSATWYVSDVDVLKITAVVRLI